MYVYLPPVVDLFNGEIVAYATSRSPLFTMVGAYGLSEGRIFGRQGMPGSIQAGCLRFLSPPSREPIGRPKTLSKASSACSRIIFELPFILWMRTLQR